ncbi:hypothetical protein ACIO3O_36995 [Streptomyces sp. NPDC087440]|uniref:hypothetical protein n=1 Tax=Streptomyces sp. NPDC087440 TaxID=3365790 RepID=UPI00380F16FD
MTTVEIVAANHHRAAHAAREAAEMARSRSLHPATPAAARLALKAIAAHLAVVADDYAKAATEPPLVFAGVIVTNVHPVDASFALMDAEQAVENATGPVGFQPNEITTRVHDAFRNAAPTG